LETNISFTNIKFQNIKKPQFMMSSIPLEFTIYNELKKKKKRYKNFYGL